MKFISILILLVTTLATFSSCHKQSFADFIANDIYFKRYLNLANDYDLVYLIPEDFQHTLCSGEVVSRDVPKIVEEMENISKALKKGFTNRIGVFVEDAKIVNKDQFNFVVRNTLTEKNMTSEWVAEMQNNHWTLTSRKDTC